MSENRPSALMEQVERLRQEIGAEGVYERLENQGVWATVCAALDVLDDTELAIYAYNPAIVKDDQVFIGEKYLRIYGVMQAAQLKIYAVRTLIKILASSKLKFDENMSVKRVVIARSILAGHPIRQSKNNNVLSSFLSQVELESGVIRATQLTNTPSEKLLYATHTFKIETLLYDLNQDVITYLEKIQVN